MKKSNLSSKNKNFDLASFMNGNGRIYLMLIVSAFTIFLTVAGFNAITDLEYNYGFYPVKEYGYSFSNCFTLEYIFITVVSVVLGATSFQFLTNKQQGITMLSLPLKRSKLFDKSVVLPVCGLALIVIAVKVYIISCNVKIFGVNNDLILQGVTDILICLKYVLLGFTAFCVSSIACGKKLEVAFGGVSLIGIMPVIYKVVDSLLDIYLFGYDSILYSITKIYSEFLFILNPARELSLLFFFDETPSYTIDKLIVNVIWVVVLILVLVFAKQYFIKNYKAEKIEIKSTNKPMLAIIGAFIGLSIAQIVLSIIMDESIYNDFEVTSGLYVALLCVLTVVFAFLTICLVETSFRLNKNKLIAVLSPVSVIVLTLIYAFSGGLGYEKRIPDTKDIETIEISTSFNGSGVFNTLGSYDVYSRFEDCYTFTTKNDFEVIKDIQKTTIENRDMDTGESISITYVLKDGRMITRNYNALSNEATVKLLALWKTDSTKKDVEDYLLNNKPTNTNPSQTDSYYFEDENSFTWDYYEEPHSVFNLSENKVYIASKQNTGTNITDKLTEAKFTRIKEAIYKDYCELTAEEWFKPTKTYGAIAFTYNNKYYADMYGDYYEEDEVLYESDTVEITIGEEVPQINQNTTGGYNFWGGFVGEYEQVTIPVTAEMKNTVAVLKELNLYQYLTDNKEKIERVFIADAKEYFDWKTNLSEEYELYYSVYDASVHFLPDSDLGNDIMFFGKSKYTINEVLQEQYANNVFWDDAYNSLGALDYTTAPVTEIKNPKEKVQLLTETHIAYYDEKQEGKILFVDYAAGIDTAYYIPA